MIVPTWHPAFRRLADHVPALLEARSNEAAVDLECGKKGDAVSIWKKLRLQPSPLRRLWRIWAT